MGFYNILYLLKKISFNFTNILKFLCIFMIIILISFSLMLIFSKSVSAETIQDYSSAISNAVSNISEIQSGANWCVVKCNDNNYYLLTCGSYAQGLNYFANFVQNSQNYIFSCGYQYKLSTRGGTFYYRLNTNGTYTFYGEDNSSHRLNLTMPNTYFSSTDIHYENSSNVYFSASSYFVPPTFENYDNSNWGNTLVNGEFNYFYINANSSSQVILYFYDVTYSISSGQDDVSWSVVLDANSPYVHYNTNGDMWWGFDKNIPFGVYLNNHSYQLSFQYLDDNNNWQSSQVYSWTTDFSASVIADSNVSNIGEINKGVQDINSFLNDKSSDNSSILNGMPSNNLQDPTSSQVDNIFIMLRNAFNLNNAVPVVFHVPNTDEDITIPADLVTSKIPQPLLILIQGFYWYIICRFIIKDISKVVERAKSGEILDAKDGNIKTDLL